MQSNENFIPVKAGTFMMGAWDYGYWTEKPLHRVTLKQDFYISQYQVTIREYMNFANQMDSHYPDWCKKGSEYNLETGNNNKYKGQNFDDDAPVIGISWEDTKAYCIWRSNKEEKSYRLPTEAEWEYASRAGTTTKYSFGDDMTKLKEYAWYKDNSKVKKHLLHIGKRQAHSVGSKKPNPWGLYDMYGNVWEWCEDNWYGEYETTPIDGSAYKDSYRPPYTVRGGSYNQIGEDCSSSYRRGMYNGNPWVGFRLVFSN